MKLLLIPLLLLSGCATTKPEPKVVATMSIYRTDHGFLVVSDQSGEAIVVEFNINQIVTKRKDD